MANVKRKLDDDGITGVFERELAQVNQQQIIAHRATRAALARRATLIVARDRAAAHRLARVLLEAELLAIWRYASTSEGAETYLVNERFDLALVEPDMLDEVRAAAARAGMALPFVSIDEHDARLVETVRAALIGAR